MNNAKPSSKKLVMCCGTSRCSRASSGFPSKKRPRQTSKNSPIAQRAASLKAEATRADHDDSRHIRTCWPQYLLASARRKVHRLGGWRGLRKDHDWRAAEGGI